MVKKRRIIKRTRRVTRRTVLRSAPQKRVSKSPSSRPRTSNKPKETMKSRLQAQAEQFMNIERPKDNSPRRDEGWRNT
jgi:hypothetical protein